MSDYGKRFFFTFTKQINFFETIRDMSKKQVGPEVQNLYIELIESIRKLLTKQDEEQIRHAFEFAHQHLEGNHDEEGVARIIHNLQVAIIVADQIGLGVRTVICALLHNLPKEGDVTIDQIREEFGEQIAGVIEGYRKISDLRTHRTAFQSENFRKLLLSLSGDVRVILLRLADRLQKMREVDYKEPERQLIYATEAKHLYIPLAHRLGIYNIKTELEERVMKYTETDIYRDIAKKLKNTKSERERFIKKFISPIESEIQKLGVKYELKGRPKSIHSIWNKMRKQKVGFDEVYDKFAIRIILDSPAEKEKGDCWSVYSIVTNLYQPNPKRMRDWISAPKNTGYESLHATVVGPDHKWVEVQIRSSRMDEVAEKGHAAHWRYKENKTGQSNEQWLARIREILENPEPEVLDKTDEAKMELYTDNIFVFTPKGDIKKLQVGATVLDFAFSIHSNVGAQCVGAKVNGKNVQIKNQLHNGDQIEIITSKKQKPTIDWINLVTSNRSKQRIKRLLREEEYKEANAGKEILIRKFNQAKVKFNDPNLNAVVEHFGYKKPLELYIALAEEQLDAVLIRDFFTDKNKKTPTDPALESKIKQEVEKIEAPKEEEFLTIGNDSSLKDYKFAKCCHPGFGDEVFGFVTVGQGIKIHSKSCPNALQLLNKYPYRVIKAKWGDPNVMAQHLSAFKITANDELGLINQLSAIISNDLRVNIKAMSFESKEGKAYGNFEVYVKDHKHIDVLLAKLGKVKGVIKVARQ